MSSITSTVNEWMDEKIKNTKHNQIAELAKLGAILKSTKDGLELQHWLLLLITHYMCKRVCIVECRTAACETSQRRTLRIIRTGIIKLSCKASQVGDAPWLISWIGCAHLGWLLAWPALGWAVKQGCTQENTASTQTDKQTSDRVSRLCRVSKGGTDQWLDGHYDTPCLARESAYYLSNLYAHQM